MTTRYRLTTRGSRGGTFYCVDKTTGKRISLKTTDADEAQQIIDAKNPERKALYQLCWHLGASQGDIASLKGEDVDWENGTVSFTRKKTGVPVIVHLGSNAQDVFIDLPSEGALFPYLS